MTPRFSDAEPGAAGFTLLELLVALAVFAIAALALFNLSGQNERSAGFLQEKLFAQIVAENQAAEAAFTPLARLAPRAGGEEMEGGERFLWTRLAEPTADPAISRLTVSVRTTDRPQVLAEIVLFKGRTP